MKTTLFTITSLFALLLAVKTTTAQTERVEELPFGNMDTWMVRKINESAIIGGNTRYSYEITRGDTLVDAPYKNTVSPWGTSSVLAKVSGITKSSVTVFPEQRGEGYCARLETRIETVQVLGIININVLASGTIFLGEMVEPITDTKNPQSKLVTGIPFTGRPSALQFDYKVVTGGDCIRSTGFSRQRSVDRKDMAEVQILLQHRWEDEFGNVYAKRVGTGWERFGRTQAQWQNGHRIPVHYGDISSRSFYGPYMGLKQGEETYYTRNSKGKMVPIQESGWGDGTEEVTHLFIQFSSSNGGAYIGSTDSRLWVDNVKLVY